MSDPEKKKKAENYLGGGWQIYEWMIITEGVGGGVVNLHKYFVHFCQDETRVSLGY